MLFSAKEKAQGMVEYVLIIIMVALVMLVVLALLGSQLSNAFSRLVSEFQSL